MIIVGVDPAVRRIAVFWLNTETEEDFGHVCLEAPKSTRGNELEYLNNSLSEYLDLLDLSWERQPIVFCEEPILGMSKNVQTAIGIAQTTGVVLGVRYRTYHVSSGSWKKTVIGNGRATKAQVADWLQEVKPHYFKNCAGDQDAIDAACIALYGAAVAATAVGIGRPGDVSGSASSD